MKQILKLVFLLVIGQTAFAQAPSNYTNINGRYRWIAGMFDSTFHIPKGSTPSLRTGGSTNSGGLFYNTSDSSVYTYTGTQWIKLRGSINPSDTTNKYVTQVYKKNASDSVFYVKGGNHLFAFIDSVGSPGGGGGGKVYYFNGGVSMGTFGGFAMYELGDTANTGAAANFTRATTGNIANFITDPGKPGLLQIPAGVWTIDAWLSETGGGANHAEIYVQVEKWDGSTIIPIATSPVEQITEGGTPNLYTWSVSIPTTALTVTDRIIIQFYIQNTNGKTVTLYTQNGYVGEVHTTFTTGIGAINGLTAPAQYLVTGTSGTDFNINSSTATHTFNLPTASATNRGALSTTDWSTFNNKIGGSLVSGYLTKATGTNTIDTSQIYQTNGKIGIGRTNPTAKVDVYDSLGTGIKSTLRTQINTDVALDVKAVGNRGFALIVDQADSVASGTQYQTLFRKSMMPGTGNPANGGGVSWYTQIGNDNNVYRALSVYRARVIDSTGFANSNIQQTSTEFWTRKAGVWDTTLVLNGGNVGINTGQNGIDSALTVVNGAYFQRGVRMSGLPTGVGTKAVRINANGTLSVADTLANGISGTGTTTYLSKFTGSTSIGNSMITEGAANEVALEGNGTTGGSLNLKHYASFSGKGVGYSWIGVSSNNYWFQSQTASGTKSFYFDITNNTLNSVRQYIMPNASGTLALTSDITSAISGTTNYIPKFTSSSAIGNSQLVENGSTFYYDNGLGRYAIVNASAENTVSSYTTNANAYNDFVTRAATHQWRIANSEVMRLTSGGSLGIGTSTPAQKLTVAGDVQIGETANPGALRFIGAADKFNFIIGKQINVNNAFEITPSTAAGGTTFSTPALVVTSGGNIGINTSSPNYSGYGANTRVLTVLGNAADNYGVLELAAPSVTASNRFGEIRFLNLAATGGVYGFSGLRAIRDGADNSSALAFWTSSAGTSSERMRLDASGNLGLGTSSPESILHIAKSNSGGIGAQIILDNNGSTALNNAVELSFLTDAGASGTGVRNARIQAVNENANNGAANLQFWTWNGSTDAERLRLTSGGNLGLAVSPSAWYGTVKAMQFGTSGSIEGRSNNTSYLAVGANYYLNGSAANTYISTNAASKYEQDAGTHKWYYAPSGTANTSISFTQAMTLDASGRLGIGTTSPSAKLQVNGSGANSIFESGAASDARIELKYNTSRVGIIGWDVDNVSLFADTGDYLKFGTNNTERMRITSGGDVAIGSTTPASIGTGIRVLDVQGTNAGGIALGVAGTKSYIYGASTLYVEANTTLTLYTSGSEKARLTSAGELLINTTSDAGDYKLQVNGNVYATGGSIINNQNATTVFSLNNSTAGGSAFTEFRINASVGTGAFGKTSASTTAYKTIAASDLYIYNNTGAGNIAILNDKSGGSITMATNGNSTAQFTLTSSGNVETTGSIKTAAPSGGNAAAWKLGERVASAGVTFNDQQYIQLDIGGTLYYLATVDLPMPEAYPQATSGPSNNYKIAPVQVKTTRDAEIEKLRKEIEELKQLIKNK